MGVNEQASVAPAILPVRTWYRVVLRDRRGDIAQDFVYCEQHAKVQPDIKQGVGVRKDPAGGTVEVQTQTSRLDLGCFECSDF